MESIQILNYISEENNAKILSCSSEKENFIISNVLSNIEKVRI